MTADVVALLKKARSMGADFWVEGDTWWSAPRSPYLGR